MSAVVSLEPEQPWTLDDLAAQDFETLGAVYARGSVAPLEILDGDPVGRMLTMAWAPRPGRRFRFVSRLARSGRFPWGGKSFVSKASDRGQGVNRVRLDRLRRWYPFETFVGPSVVDGEPCIVLNYDLPENPFFIRAIHDEVREVSPGVFLGPAMLKRRADHQLVLWFALAA